MLEARLRADTAFYQGCTDVERLIRHYMARSCWVNHRVRRAATYEAGVVIQREGRRDGGIRRDPLCAALVGGVRRLHPVHVTRSDPNFLDARGR